ncbi:MAG: WG repeat-containing protein [Crocinitomicaceae bacterium]|nr:WG repeat-containing protein [Crocinitomicaceae bacterium]
MKHFLIFVFAFCLMQFTQAQELRIVKDNINCTYGIKDDAGKWVVEANYILIEQYNTGYFRVRDEIGLGVLTPEGKQLLPCIHDQITISTYNWRIRNRYDSYQNYGENTEHVYFYAVKNNRQLVYNLRGEKMASFGIHTDFKLDSDYSIIAYNRNSRFSRYIDSTGRFLIDSIQGKIAPFNGENYTLVGDNISANDRANGNARVVNRKGELLLDIEMDYALIDSKSRVCFSIDKRYGVISLSGDTIIAPKYKRLDGALHIDAKKMWPIYDDEGKAGVMKNDGTIRIDPQYDNIYAATGLNRVKVGWMVEKDKRFGLLDLDGKEMIPMNYDQMYAVNFMMNNARTLTTNYIGRSKGKFYYLTPNAEELSSVGYDSILPVSEHHYSYSLSLTRGLITKNKGKYGVLNPDGSELVGCNSDLKFLMSKGRYILGQSANLTEYRFNRDAIETIEWVPLASDGRLNIYYGNDRYIGLDKKKSGQIGKSQLQSFQKYGNLLTANYADTREWVFFDLTAKKRLPLKNIYSFRSNGNDQFVISTRQNHHGIIDANANLIIDTIYNNITLNRNSSNFWVAKVVGDHQVNMLLDSVGQPVIPNQFDGSFELNSGDKIVSQNQKKGLIDSKTLQWKIRPNNVCLIRLFDDYYYAGNEYNKKGIVKADGKVVLPIAYDTIILLYSNCQMNGMCPTDDPTKIRWLVRKGSAEYLADETGKLLNSRSAIRRLKESLFFDHDTLFGYYNQYRTFPVLDYTPSLHFLRGLTMKQIQAKRRALWKNPILKGEVLDTINRLWNSFVPNCNRGYYWGITTYGNQAKPKPLAEKARRSCEYYQSNPYYFAGNYLVYQLRLIGKKFLTMDISYQNQNNSWDPLRSQAPPPIPENQHINIIEQNGKARYLSLKDIFPDDDILMQEFMASLQKRDDLQLECSSLENMLAMVNGSFSLSDEGVHLYLSQYSLYSNSPMELLIPVENLAKLSKSKWIVPLLK